MIDAFNRICVSLSKNGFDNQFNYDLNSLICQTIVFGVVFSVVYV